MFALHKLPLRSTIAVLVLAATGVGGVVLAQDRPPRRPPQVALDACRDRAAGASCSFEGPDGESITGSCRAPEGLPLACAPARGPGPHFRPLPPEAIEACIGIADGDACAVDTPRGTVEGTCRGTPEGLACLLPLPPR